MNEKSRSENFSITIKDDPQFKVKHLQVGDVEILLTGKNINGLLYLQGLYSPESPKNITIADSNETADKAAPKIFDIKNSYLLIENIL